MLRFSVRFLALATSLAALSMAGTITGTISGTCGFYQGSLSNVVYSEAFSGDGTFCTGFLTGGSFTNSGILQAGDIYALAHNSISAAAPTGYGVFVDFSSTFQVTQQYILTPPNPSPTATGSATTFLDTVGSTDDGSGLGLCSEHTSLNLAGFSNPFAGTQFSIPITFGQPITAVETASMTCSDYGPVGIGFGDDGMQESYAGTPLLLYDANGNLLGPATLTTVPEPSPYLILPLGLILFIPGRALLLRV